MAIVDSVFTEVVSDLQAGTILVGQLELIQEHSTQFLSICDLSKWWAEVRASGC